MFRFTIRDVLWLTVVVAMGADWWAERNRAELAHRQASKHSSRVLQLESTLDRVLQLWELDVPGTVMREHSGANRLYTVNTKSGERHYFPFRNNENP